MCAQTLARVALLALAGTSLACGAPSPGPGDGAWHVATALPPASGLAGYDRAGSAGFAGPGWGVGPGPWTGGWHRGNGRGPDWGGGPGWGGGFDGGWGGPWGWPYYVPPVMVWGPFSPIPLLDLPGPSVGPVAPFFDPFGFGIF